MPKTPLSVRQTTLAIQTEWQGLGGRLEIIELLHLCQIERIPLRQVIKVIEAYANYLDSTVIDGKMAA